jgi:hypothetical protein
MRLSNIALHRNIGCLREKSVYIASGFILNILIDLSERAGSPLLDAALPF